MFEIKAFKIKKYGVYKRKRGFFDENNEEIRHEGQTH